MLWRPVHTALLLLLALVACRQPATDDRRVLLDFERADEIARLIPQNDITVGRASTWAAHGTASLQLTVPAATDLPTVDLDRQLLRGWAGTDFLAFEVYTTAPVPLPIVVELHDAPRQPYAERATYEGLRRLPATQPGTAVTVLVDLRQAWRNGREGLGEAELQPADRLALAKLTTVRLWIDRRAVEGEVHLWLDHFRLLPASAVGKPLHVAMPATFRAFDFGDPRNGVDGFTPVSATSPTGNGWTLSGPASMADGGGSWPDRLAGDYVVPTAKAPGLSGVAGEVRFHLALPPGQVAVWVIGGHWPAPGLQPRLAVNGQTVWEADLRDDGFYTSPDGFFRCFNLAYSERPHALWEDAIQRLFPARLLAVDVADDGLTVSVRDGFLSALVVAPVAEQAALHEVVARLDMERRASFEAQLQGQRPTDEPWSRPDPALALAPIAGESPILPWTGLSADAPVDVERVATLGERLWLRIAVKPFQPLGELHLSLEHASPLLPAEASIWRQRYLADGRSARAWCLEPSGTLDASETFTQGLFIALRFDRPGDYRGALLVSGPDGLERRLPIAIRIADVRALPVAEVPMALGLFYLPPNRNGFTGLPEIPSLAALAGRHLDGQMALLHDVGFTSIELPSPELTDGTLDVRPTLAVADAARRAGMLANDRQRAPLFLLRLTRHVARDLGAGMPPPGDELRVDGYPEALRQQFVALPAKLAALPVAYWLADEPREVPNPWNRTLADTLAYCRLAAEAGLAPRLVTLSADRSGETSMLPLLASVDIAAVHPLANSAELLAAARQPEPPELWLYNCGRSRLSWGFHPWALGATGRFEWHATTWTDPRPQNYAGGEPHNPFVHLATPGYLATAPLNYPGGVLPTPDLVAAEEGLNDLRLLLALDPHLPANAQFLDELRQAVPVLLDTAPAFDVEAWRQRLIEALEASRR